MNEIAQKIFFLFIIFSGCSTVARADYAQIKDEAVLYYEDSGAGQAIIFVPGWTASHDFFKKQVAYFSKSYRVITFDPRGQGMSPATLENNNYMQHGKDLSALISKLQLKHVILVAWSWGCYDAYSYVRLNGVSNIKAFVCIDASPKASGGIGEWTSRASLNGGADLMRQIAYNRYKFLPVWAQSMVERRLNPDELNWIVSESLRTPTYVALLLLFDALYADYRSEAILLDKSIPVLNVISKPLDNPAKTWLGVNAPHSKTIIMGKKHMMFWEHADEFNQSLNEFLDSLSVNR